MTEKMSDTRWEEIKNAILSKKMYTGDLMSMEEEIERAREVEKALEAVNEHLCFNSNFAMNKASELEKENVDLSSKYRRALDEISDKSVLCGQLIKENTELKELVDLCRQANSNLIRLTKNARRIKCVWKITAFRALKSIDINLERK